MKRSALKYLILIALFGLIGAVYWQSRTGTHAPGEAPGERSAVPVEVQDIRHGAIELRRTFSGTLEPRAQFVVAPKVSGRLDHIAVNIADVVRRGQLIAELENDEYVQAVAQAEANLAVARANLSEAASELEIASRELERVETLRQRGVASESQLDAARAVQLAKKVKKEVAEATVTRAGSLLETENIRLRYTRIMGEWSGGADSRVVAERFVDAGEMVSANTPLLRIVELAPIVGVIHVTERDYARLQVGQPVTLTTDAYPGEQFHGRIERIAPVFLQATRQARVELLVDNDSLRLKPGMFVRATVVIDRREDATLVPEEALTRRDDRYGVFLVDQDGGSVHWREVDIGIRDGSMAELSGAEFTGGRVVTLGQQLLKDGARIVIPADEPLSSSAAEQNGR